METAEKVTFDQIDKYTAATNESFKKLDENYIQHGMKKVDEAGKLAMERSRL